MSGSKMAAGFGNVWPLAMAFAGLAVFAAGLLHRQTQVTAVATSVLVAMYVMNILAKLAPDASWMRNFSAFYYYGSAIQTGLDPAHALLLAAVGVLLAVAGMEMFERRDVL
jgi:putative exporter of polyketide antibiotics